MSSTSDEPTSRRGRSLPPDRLTAVLDEVDRARRTGGWTPEEPADRGRRSRDPDERRTASSAPRHLRHRPSDAVRPHTPLVRPPAGLRDAVVAPGRLAAVAVLVLLIATGLVLGGRLLWLRATSEPQPADPVPASTPSRVQGTPLAEAATATRRSSAGEQAAASPAQIVVHVVGQVERPGVVTLRSGARVRDALTAAGGAQTSADLGRLNLARPVVDGEQVMVPKPGEEITTAPGQAPGPAAPQPSGGGGSAEAGSATGAPVDLNQADAGALEELPGIGPVLAGRIVQWRTDNGPFSSVDELGEVSGIGEKMLAQLRPHVTV